MPSTLRKFAVAASVAGIAAVGAAPSVFASTNTAHLTPANTVITGNLKTGTAINFAATVDGFALTVNCTVATASGKTPANGLSVTLSKPPTFSGCTDSLGGTDTVTTAGTWKLVANSTGSSLSLKVPVKGATFTSNLLSGCVITVAPTKAASIGGKYNNLNTWTIAGAKFAISGAGCSTSATSTAKGTLVFSPNVSVAP